MNVLLLVPEYPPQGAGIARSAQRLAAGLTAIGSRVVVVTKSSDARMPLTVEVVAEQEPGGAALITFPYGSFFTSHWARELDEVAARLHGGEPHIVHAIGSLRFGQIAVVLGRRFGAAVVYGMRGCDVTAEALHSPGQFEAVVCGADALTAVSEELASRAKSMSASARRVITIRSSVHTADVRRGELGREEIGLPASTPVLGARLDRRWVKGPDRLLRMVALVSQRCGGPLALCLFGARDSQQRFAKAWQSGGNGRDRPFRDLGELPAPRVFDVLGVLDLLLISSHYEGMPNLMLEALSVGTPVAATPAGGCREVLEASGAGLLLPWNETEAAAAVVRLLESRELEAMRARARTHVSEHHSPSREARAVYDLYRSLARPAAVRDGASPP